jgi:sulfide:quinone oxidoreductase
MDKVVILGGGTGGTLSANRLRRMFPAEDVAITVVDDNDDHVYQPGLLFVPFGIGRVEDLTRSRAEQLRPGIDFLLQRVVRVDLAARRVELANGEELGYDVLIVATGAVLASDETEGLTGPGWLERVFTFYTSRGATALAAAMEDFRGGRLVVNIVDLPIKCPVAPLEFSFLADWFFHKRGLREAVEITFVTPLDGAFTQPVCSRVLGGMLEERGIALVSEFNTAKVDGEAGVLTSYDGRDVPFDLAVVIPAHSGAPFVAASEGLGDELGFVPTDPHTLQSLSAPNVFVIGDAAAVPTSKAGSVAHFEGEVLVENVRRYLAGEPLVGRFDGHSNCFIETGFAKAMLVDFNYEVEPVTGHYPTVVGLPLLKESRLNHLGKLMFQSLYWHSLLPGRDLPGVGATMPTAGKHLVDAARREN